MKRECKICLPAYKLAYSIIFIILLSLVRGISGIFEIGITLDANIVPLVVIFCSDTYEMEYQGKRWEIFRLLPAAGRAGAVRRRLILQTVYLCLLSYVGYFFFYWQKPRSPEQMSGTVLYAQYLIAVTVTVVFWGVLSQTLVNLCKNLWVGIGISVMLWLFVNSKGGSYLLGNWSVLSFVFRGSENYGDLGWLAGKGAALLLAALLTALIPVVLRKRDGERAIYRK